MRRIACIILIVLFVAPCISDAETIDVQIKGVDDGVKTTKQQDYKEAVLFAKREAIERAGVKVKALTTAKDFVVHSDYIETKAEAVLLPGYKIVDVGYQKDGTYLVVLIGKVKSSTPGSSSREIGRDGRYVAYGNGVVWDTNTTLEWIAGPDRDTNWHEAKSWVENLAIDGGGWRMPTRAEVKTLYKLSAGTNKMTPFLRTTGLWVWSCETERSSLAWGVNFSMGYMLIDIQDDVELRGLAVRYRR